MISIFLIPATFAAVRRESEPLLELDNLVVPDMKNFTQIERKKKIQLQGFYLSFTVKLYCKTFTFRGVARSLQNPRAGGKISRIQRKGEKQL